MPGPIGVCDVRRLRCPEILPADAITDMSDRSAVLIAIVTVACGGGETQTSFQTRVSAATGGTVTAGDATLVIPAGALSQDTTITVTISSPGSSLPESSTVKGEIYDFGPNGTTFSTPATLTLPMTDTPAANERAVISFLDPVTDQWVDLTSTVTGAQISAPISHFTPHAARFGLELVQLPRRNWGFNRTIGYGELDFNAPFVIDERTGGEVNESFLFGAADPTFEQDNGESPGLAVGKVFSSPSGETFWAEAEAPSGDPNIPDFRSGGEAYLAQFQSYVKRAPDATLQLVLSAGFLAASDHNGRPLSVECHLVKDGMSNEEILDICVPLWTTVEFKAVAYREPLGPGKERREFFSVHGSADMMGFDGTWAFYPHSYAPSSTPLWTAANFTVTGLDGRDPLVALNGPLVVDIDLSSIDVCPPDLDAIFCGDKEFTLSSYVYARAWNWRGRESGAAAYLRDPQNIGGSALRMTGLEATNNPLPLPTARVEAPLPCASGSDPAAGVLQFSAGSYTALEGRPGARALVITRTLGSKGAVSAIFSASDGTAVGGVDYTAPATSVVFADGDAVPRSVELTVLPDTMEEPDKTVMLTLSDPGGCATLGAQASAVLTILDDDAPFTPPPVFTVGGTVTGLVGTGLVLRNAGLDLSPGNGAFTFPQPLPSGIPYSVTVVTQPMNPNQVCSVTNGSGTISDADVTNVAVDCVTSPTNGALDPGFGSGGKVTGLLAGASAMALQTDGKIVVVGDRSLSRHNTDGSPDTGFGTGGAVTVVFTGALDEAQGVAIQPDGKIVVAGTTRGGTPNDFGDFAVARYNADGSLDTSFGTGGKVTTNFNAGIDEASAVRVQPDGKIVVAGSAAASASFPVDNDFAVARYTGAGALDTGFGTGGKVTTNVAGRTDLVNAAVLQSDGKIILAGRVADGSGVEPDLCLVRYNANGSPDLGFGNNGILRSNLGLGNWEEATDLVMQPDGQIVVATLAVVAGKFNFGVARFDAAGRVDGSFGNGGVATTGFPAQDDYANAVALQPDGSIVVAGRTSSLASADFALARFDSGGVLDGSFGTGGKVTIDFFAGSDGAECVAVQPDGKIVLAGFAQNGAGNGLALARVNP